MPHVFENGRTYAFLSERYPAFLAEYPLKEYSIENTREDFLSANRGFLELAKAALSNGTSLSAGGLPELCFSSSDKDDPIPGFRACNMFIFTSSLIERKTGKVVVNGSACNLIAGPKDFERGETAAIQRMIAAAGHSSENYLSDEQIMISSQSLTKAPALKSDQPSEIVATAETPDSTQTTVSEKHKAVEQKIRSMMAPQLTLLTKRVVKMGYVVNLAQPSNDAELREQLNMVSDFVAKVQLAQMGKAEMPSTPVWAAPTDQQQGG